MNNLTPERVAGRIGGTVAFLLALGLAFALGILYGQHHQ